MLTGKLPIINILIKMSIYFTENFHFFLQQKKILHDDQVIIILKYDDICNESL